MAVSSIKLLEQFLGYCSTKNKVITNNIANVGTENYKREDVVFKNLMAENITSQLKATDKKHFTASGSLSQAPFEIIMDENDEKVSGANNVNIDKEMAELAANSIYFKFASQKIGGYYKGIQSVIKGDR